MLGQSQNTSLNQSFSPRQIQLMQLLQLPVMELEQRIKEELEKNPTLEEARPGDNDSPDKQEEFETKGADERNSEYDDDYFQQYMEDDPGSYQQKAGADIDDYAAQPSGNPYW